MLDTNVNRPDFAWLNESSRIFLHRGYLLEGTEPEDRVRYIAGHAEKLLDYPGFADKFYHYMARGYYSLASPIWSNFGLDRGLPISCVTGDTWINTNNGGKQAKDIVVGDMVLTHKNRYRPVTKVIPTKDKDDIYRLKVSLEIDELYITGNHPVLTQEGWVKVEDLDINKHLVAVNNEILKNDKDHVIDENVVVANDGIEYYSILSLEKTDRVEDVYDFTVEEDHSFSCAGVIVHNCFGSYIGDSIYDIMSTTAEVGMMSKTGGGTSGYFGAIRPRGALIKDNGHSDGSFNFAKLFDTVIDVISQGTCYEEGTEVLTSNGFKDFRDVKKGEDKLAQVDTFGKISFTEHYELIEEDYSGVMYQFKGKKKDSLIDISVTPNHRMVIEQQGGNTNGKVGKYWPGVTEIVKAEDLKLGTWNKMYVSGESAYDGPDLSFADRFRIAFQADGRKDGPNRKIRFRFVKSRKIDRLLVICEQLGLKPEVSENADGVTEISVPYIEELKKEDFSWVDISRISRKWCYEFINELSLWDGTTSENGFRVYHTTSKINADIAQTIGSMAFLRTRLSVLKREDEGKQDLYRVGFGYIGWVKGDSIETVKKEYTGKVYCATVRTGILMVRRNGRILQCGNSRKGQFAGYIDIEHPDIEEWLDIHKEGNPIQLMYYGVCIGDQWLQEMKDGDKEKRRIWAKVLQRKAESGIPYLFFKDNVNNQKPDVYKDKDMTIYASNLCVSGDTTILTKEYGHTPIAEHVGEYVTVWNGEEWSPNVQLVKTGENQQLYLVKLSNGREIKCTGYHKWFVKNDYSKDPVVMNTLELQHGFKLDKWSLPIMEGTLELEDAYTNGFYTGDGCYFKGANLIYLYHQKKALRPHITGNIINEAFSTSADRITLRMKGLRDKFFVPNHEYTIKSRLEWLAGYLDADGTIYRNDANEQIVATSINEDFLIEVQDMLSTLGVHSKLKLMHDERVSWLPLNDGSGDYGEFLSKRCYRLIISSTESQKLLDLGIKFHRLFIEKRLPNRSAYRYVSVESVWELAEKEDTYCCNEPLRHRVIFNGVNTGNCSEIALPSSLEESFVCCLSSMNALYFDEWKETDAVETMTYFLDAVMEEFIQKSKSIPMMEKAHRFASRHRAIGIGVLGWHSYLQYKHTPFESFQAMQLNNELFKTIQERSYAASREMATRYGEPEVLKGYGRRHTCLQSVAPTKSSSFILGGVSPSVEPIRSNYYIKDLAKIKTTYRNPLLTKVLQEKGLDNEATWQSILVNDGSVQHLEGLSDEDKEVFKTWQEISQLTIIQQAAQRQKYIDQGQSINILVHPDTPTKDINQLYLTAHELGMKSIYYQFSMSAAQKFNRALLNTCTTCES
jgi:ribonucleoside-diphosphate reductase large chain|nr:MAG TPA: ribonucleotide-diphosphate reductase subunit alpha [Caudoviricetes sp.]